MILLWISNEFYIKKHREVDRTILIMKGCRQQTFIATLPRIARYLLATAVSFWGWGMVTWQHDTASHHSNAAFPLVLPPLLHQALAGTWNAQQKFCHCRRVGCPASTMLGEWEFIYSHKNQQSEVKSEMPVHGTLLFSIREVLGRDAPQRIAMKQMIRR